jgi:hypothetical protein
MVVFGVATVSGVGDAQAVSRIANRRRKIKRRCLIVD